MGPFWLPYLKQIIFELMLRHILKFAPLYFLLSSNKWKVFSKNLK